MAGGIDWFRWHHGSVSDQKFGLVAKRAGASVAEVIAVWACLLEAASAAEERGNPGLPDFEAMDFALGIEDGKSRRVYERMRERSLLDGETGRIAAWEKRQPKRERPDDNSTERSRAHRERQADQCNATQRHATPEEEEQHQETPRVEKSREEKSNTSPNGEGARKRASAPACHPDVDPQVWSDWLALRRAKKAPVTQTVVENAVREASKASMTLNAFLSVWCARGSQGLQAEWLNPEEKARGSPAETSFQRSMRERVEQFAPGIAAKPPRPAAEVIDVTPRIMG